MQTNIQILRYRLDNFYKDKKIPVWVFGQNYEIIYTNFTTSAILNILESVQSQVRSFRLAHSIEGYYLNFDNPHEMYFLFSFDVGKHQSNTVIVGPVLKIKPTENIWKELSFNQNLFAEQKRVLSHSIPVISEEDFKLSITTIMEEVYETTAPSFPVSEGSSEEPVNNVIVNIPTEQSYDRDDLSEYNEICRLEDLFRFYIINGSTYQLYGFFKDENAMCTLFTNKTSPTECAVRCVELLTIAKMASTESGNDSRISHSRFQKYIDMLKNVKTYEKMVDILQKAAIDFAKGTHDIHHYTSSNYSPMTNKCIQRIIERLPDKISLEELAKELHISAKYLSALFNKETGSSITDFMQDIRVNEAKHLLTSSSMSYLEISNSLNFSSQSYFNLVFKKKTGFTPKEYREQAFKLSEAEK
ncbi:helix-turn-helix domain-containing protein [Butyrivibrio sp. MB2005]|uniref:helix-turn-helix domain-containing protein n=1 Tax=Butyrivibrio sp. MB2005 TaxID=1280678 RepID=UPI00042A3551|nr:AraC family transcriptional regulator [Butyrivibrio sp. MB2005]